MLKHDNHKAFCHNIVLLCLTFGTWTPMHALLYLAYFASADSQILCPLCQGLTSKMVWQGHSTSAGEANEFCCILAKESGSSVDECSNCFGPPLFR